MAKCRTAEYQKARQRKSAYVGVWVDADMKSTIQSQADEAGNSFSEELRKLVLEAMYPKNANEIIERASGGKLDAQLLSYLEAVAWHVQHELTQEHGKAIIGDAELSAPSIWVLKVLRELREWLGDNPYHPEAEAKITEAMRELPAAVIAEMRRDLALLEKMAADPEEGAAE